MHGQVRGSMMSISIVSVRFTVRSGLPTWESQVRPSCTNLYLPEKIQIESVRGATFLPVAARLFQYEVVLVQGRIKLILSLILLTRTIEKIRVRVRPIPERVWPWLVQGLHWYEYESYDLVQGTRFFKITRSYKELWVRQYLLR